MKFFSFVLITAMILATSCQAYKRDLILRFDENFDPSNLTKSVNRAAENYVIQSGDLIRVDVFTNGGEQLTDPSFELSQGANSIQQIQFKDRFTYLILEDGTVRLPKVGDMKLHGLTIDQAEELLQEAYEEFYVDAFVKIRTANRRVVVLGAIGNTGQNVIGSGGVVVPLENENVNILEVLALAGGIQQGGEVSNIKLIRGDLNSPEVYSIDLSTISGMQQSGMIVESGDVIYVEPWRRPFNQTLRDIAPALSLATSVTTLLIVIQSTNGK